MQARALVAGLAAGGCAAALLAAAVTVHAQGYPTRPVRLIVAAAPGGGTDIAARMIAPKLAEYLGQQVVVDNRAGGNTIIGNELVARAAPDGYTLLMGSNSTVSVAPSLYPKNPYHPIRDFAPISLVATTPFVLVVHPSVPAKTVKELIALAKSKPGRLTMASGGTGSSNHLVGELFQSLTGTKFTHVPYKGAAPAGADLMAGQVDLLFDQLSTSVGPAKSGKFRALAVTGKTRWRDFPDVPTVAESAIPGFEVISWTGLAGPPNLPPPIVERLNTELRKALAVPEVKSKLESMGGDPRATTPDEMKALVQRQYDTWKKLAADGVIKAE